MDAAVVAAAPLAHAVGRVALMTQLDAGAAVGFVVEGAARGGPVDHMDDQRTGTRTVHGRGSHVIASIVALGCDVYATAVNSPASSAITSRGRQTASTSRMVGEDQESSRRRDRGESCASVFAAWS